MSTSGYYAIDLDGTLAKYDGWQGIHHIGEPVPLMLSRVKTWIENGILCKIFTARIAVDDPKLKEEIIGVIHRWLEKHGLPPLQVTNVKDFSMIYLFDDRAFHVVPNTGIIQGNFT